MRKPITGVGGGGGEGGGGGGEGGGGGDGTGGTPGPASQVTPQVHFANFSTRLRITS